MIADKSRPVILLFAILFVWLSVDATAQRRQLPPLDFQQFRKDIAEVETPEEKLNRYVDMSLRVVRSRPDSLFVFAKEIRNMVGLEPEKQEAFALFIEANAWRAFNQDSAINYAKNAAELLKDLNEHEQYLRTQNLIGLEYRKTSDYLQAERAYRSGIEYSQLQDSTYYPIHYFYGNLGNVYSNVGANDLAVEMFEKFMEYTDNPGDRCNIKSKLAHNFLQLEEFETAEQMLLPCLEYEELPPPIQAIVRSNLSEIVAEMGQKDRSLSLMEEASAVSSNYRIPNLHFAHLVRLGNQYIDNDLIQKADSIRILIETRNFRGLNRHLRIQKAQFLSNLALASGQYKDAIVQADTAIQIAGNTDLQRYLGTVYNKKAQAFEKLGNLDAAVENFRLQDELDERQVAIEEVKIEAMMKVRYQLENR